MSITILHNPRCSKSRQAVKILSESNKSFEIVEYTKTPLNPERLKIILKKLNISAPDILRIKEASEAGILNLTGDDLLEAICGHPATMQRPVVINGNKAVIARPPEKLLEIF